MKKLSWTTGLCVLFALSLHLSEVGGQEVVRLAYSAISGAALTP